MRKYRCCICYCRLLSLKLLQVHYLRSHTKIQIIQQLLQKPYNLILKNRKKPCRKSIEVEEKRNIVYLRDNVCLTYDDKALNITDKENTSDGNWLQITFEELPNESTQLIKVETTDDTMRFLNESNGEFYQCNCGKGVIKKKLEVDSTTQTTPESQPSTSNATITNKLHRYYCTFCATTNLTIDELLQHERIHQFYCDICNCFYAWQLFQDHYKHHICPVYICHFCGLEVYLKEVLIKHLRQHLEQQVIGDVLEMEHDYNRHHVNLMNFPSSSSPAATITTNTGVDNDYNNNRINDNGSINSILQYLTFPFDHSYSRNIFVKTTCTICRCDVFACDYTMHLKTVHFRP